MIARLSGILSPISNQAAIIDVGGVGYHFHASSRCLERLGGAGSEVTVLIDTQIKDDKIVLTGFSDQGVKDIYALLQTVQGVGTKAALAILSALSPDDIVLAISARDKAMITRADGVGPKLAQRVVNELGDKISNFTIGSSATVAKENDAMSDDKRAVIADTVSALVNLGYGRGEAHSAVMDIVARDDANKLEELLSLALKEMGK